MGPIDYSVGQSQPDFLKDFQSGLQLGQGIRQIYQGRQQAEQYQADILSAMQSPTPQNFAALALKYPTQREAIKQAFDGLSEADRKDQQGFGSQAYSALISGNPEIAADITRRRIQARQNSGLDTSSEENLLSIIEKSPQQAQAALGFTLSHISDPENFAKQFAALQGNQRDEQLQGSKVAQSDADARKATTAADVAAATAGADISKAQAEAVTKGVEAKYADTEALLKLEGIRTDNQFKKDQTKIGYLNAQIARENNGVQRQKLELELQKAQSEFGDKARAKIADVESAASNIDNMLNTIERIKTNPRLNDVVGAIEGRVPALFNDQSADAIALIDTLGSQAFLSQIPNIKGMGALSNAEGEKLQAAFQNLSRKQSESQFRASLDEATRLLNKGRATVEKRYGIPLGNPDTPAAASSRPPLSSFYTAPGG